MFPGLLWSLIKKNCFKIQQHKNKKHADLIYSLFTLTLADRAVLQPDCFLKSCTLTLRCVLMIMLQIPNSGYLEGIHQRKTSWHKRNLWITASCLYALFVHFPLSFLLKGPHGKKFRFGGPSGLHWVYSTLLVVQMLPQTVHREWVWTLWVNFRYMSLVMNEFLSFFFFFQVKM